MTHVSSQPPSVEELLQRIEQLEAQVNRPRRFRCAIHIGRVPIAVLAIVLAVAVSGVTYASIPHASSAIHACKGANGALRIAKTCASGETAVTWNKRGPTGEPGPKGDLGPKGDAGPKG